MRFGYCGGYDSKELDFAKKAGFDGVEIFVHTGHELFKPSVAKKVKEEFDKRGLKVLTVFQYEDYGNPDKAKARKAQATFTKAARLARFMGTRVVTCNAFAGPPDEAEQMKTFKRVFGKFAKVAKDEGVVVGIENCPHGRRNIAYTPALWAQLFDMVPRQIGLEFDPSHLVWQGIDYMAAIYEFSDRIHAFHAKDTEVRDSALATVGIYGKGWWRYRMPGLGQIDWNEVFTALHDIKYKGDMIIEHEDPLFGGKKRDRGLELGLAHLKLHY